MANARPGCRQLAAITANYCAFIALTVPIQHKKGGGGLCRSEDKKFAYEANRRDWIHYDGSVDFHKWKIKMKLNEIK